MSNKVLVVVAHPDDEVLGCGGTIARHVQMNDEVHVMIMAEGITSRDSEGSKDEKEEQLRSLRRCAKRANGILGVEALSFCHYPDNRMDSIDLLDIIKEVEKKIEKFNPNIIYTHYSGDINIDHQIVHKAVITACRPLPLTSIEELLFFETVSSTEWQMSYNNTFSPNWFVDISELIEKKIKALMEYEMEMRNWPHPRSYQSVKTLAHWRGTSIGVEAAEAFVLGRKINY